jgi:uncharacterized membrane protein HdeD (DUF308 family)
MPAAWVERDLDGVRREAWPFLLWGVAIVLLGVAILAWPGLTAQVIIRLAGVGVLALGGVLAYGAVRLRSVSGGGNLWLVSLVPALALAAFGFVVLLVPAAVASVVLSIIAVFALLFGVWDIVSGIALLAAVRWGWVRTLRGVLLVAFGLWVLLTPVPALVAAGWAFGLFAILLGASSIALGSNALRS